MSRFQAVIAGEHKLPVLRQETVRSQELESVAFISDRLRPLPTYALDARLVCVGWGR